MTSRGQRQPTAYLLSPLTGSKLREPEFPLSPSLTSVTLFILPVPRSGDAKPVFSAAC
jgi:hypothetical protein